VRFKTSKTSRFTDAHGVVIGEGSVADRVCVDALRSGLMSFASFVFQACSFNHSDISPFRINYLAAVLSAENETV
jgi:hypothetical protein